MGGLSELGRNALLALLALGAFLSTMELLLRATSSPQESYYANVWLYSRELKQTVQEEPFLFDHIKSASIPLYGAELAVNSAGMRDREFPTAKPRGTVRIAAVGDSTTLGWGVPLERSYPKVLERMLNEGGQAYEVLNFGVGNYNTFQEYHKIARQVVEYDPDILLLQFYINDPEGTERPALYAVRRESYLFLFLWQRVVGLKNRLGLYDAKGYYGGLYTGRNTDLARNREALSGIVAMSLQNNITPYVVLIPELQTFDQGLADFQREFVTKVVGEEAVLDLTGDFNGYEPEQLHISDEDIHLNAEGHRILAEGLFARLQGSI